MALDPQIPLSSTQQPSFTQNMGQAFQLAGAYEKNQEMQQQKQDQQTIQGYLKEGGSFDTPDGLATAAEKLKGKVSLNAYQTITQAHQESKLNEKKQIEALANADLAKMEVAGKKNDLLFRAGKPVLDQYQDDLKKNADKGSQEAQRIATENFQKNWQGQVQGVAPTGVFQPQELQDAGSWTPDVLKKKVEGSEYFQKISKEAAELRKVNAQTSKELAQAEYYRKGKGAGAGAIPEEITQSTLHGQDFLDLLKPGEAADVLAVAEGRKSMSDIPVKDGRKARIGQYVTQFDPGFSNIRNPADKAAAVAISKDLSAIRPYIDMLDKNAEIAVDLSKKVIATDSRLLNKNINWLKQNMGDNPDVAEFLAQTTFVQTEAARVLNNPRLVGQLTDTARQEMEHVISGDMPLKSYERVIRRIQQDGQNRFQAMENQRNRLFGGSIGPKEVPQSELRNTGKSTEVPRGAASAKGEAAWSASDEARLKELEAKHGAQ
jgi:hypothetical protein